MINYLEYFLTDDQLEGIYLNHLTHTSSDDNNIQKNIEKRIDEIKNSFIYYKRIKWDVLHLYKFIPEFKFQLQIPRTGTMNKDDSGSYNLYDIAKSIEQIPKLLLETYNKNGLSRFIKQNCNINNFQNMNILSQVELLPIYFYSKIDAETTIKEEYFDFNQNEQNILLYVVYCYFKFIYSNGGLNKLNERASVIKDIIKRRNNPNYMDEHEHDKKSKKQSKKVVGESLSGVNILNDKSKKNQTKKIANSKKIEKLKNETIGNDDKKQSTTKMESIAINTSQPGKELPKKDEPKKKKIEKRKKETIDNDNDDDDDKKVLAKKIKVSNPPFKKRSIKSISKSDDDDESDKNKIKNKNNNDLAVVVKKEGKEEEEEEIELKKNTKKIEKIEKIIKKTKVSPRYEIILKNQYAYVSDIGKEIYITYFLKDEELKFILFHSDVTQSSNQDLKIIDYKGLVGIAGFMFVLKSTNNGKEYIGKLVLCGKNSGLKEIKLIKYASDKGFGCELLDYTTIPMHDEEWEKKLKDTLYNSYLNYYFDKDKMSLAKIENVKMQISNENPTFYFMIMEKMAMTIDDLLFESNNYDIKLSKEDMTKLEITLSKLEIFGIVHGDLHGNNIMVNIKIVNGKRYIDSFKIIDYGRSTLFDNDKKNPILSIMNDDNDDCGIYPKPLMSLDGVTEKLKKIGYNKQFIPKFITQKAFIEHIINMRNINIFIDNQSSNCKKFNPQIDIMYFFTKMIMQHITWLFTDIADRNVPKDDIIYKTLRELTNRIKIVAITLINYMLEKKWLLYESGYGTTSKVITDEKYDFLSTPWKFKLGVKENISAGYDGQISINYTNSRIRESKFIPYYHIGIVYKYLSVMDKSDLIPFINHRKPKIRKSNNSDETILYEVIQPK